MTPLSVGPGRVVLPVPPHRVDDSPPGSGSICPLCGATGIPVIMDAYSGAGGMGYGLQLAGWHVFGVDNRPQPRYPGCFVRMDALDAIGAVSAGRWRVDAIHASPPCPGRSKATSAAARDRHPRMIGPTRDALMAAALPWTMENVAAPVAGSEYLRPDLKLCACMFPELPPRLRRERWFETWPVLFDLRPPCHHPLTSISVARKGGRWAGSGPLHDSYVDLETCKRIMGIPWMTQTELGDAIPPAFGRYVGELLLASIREGAA